MDKKLIRHILENGKKIETYYQQLLEGKISNPDFCAYYETLAIPGGYTHNLNMLKQGGGKAIDNSIAYLQANPFFHRSGYIKEELLDILKRIPLSQDQISALQEILLDEITTAPTRGYSYYCRLARAIQNDQFKAKIEHIVASTTNLEHKEKAEMMLAAMNANISKVTSHKKRAPL